MNSMKRVVFFVFGILFLTFGIVGVVVPVLPTTPFLLVASFCFVRSSEKMNAWLLNHPVFGDYIKNYLEHRGIKRSDRRKSLILLWLGIGIAIVFQSKFFVQVMLFLIACLVTIHITRLKLMDE